jgi:hypothetical protein
MILRGHARHNKRTGKLPKKLKLAANKSATDKSATGESTTDDPPIDEPPKPTTLESINDPDTIEPLETSGEATRQEGNNELMARPAFASPIEDDETTISRALESDLHTITHTY